jgi:hypothetical protein
MENGQKFTGFGLALGIAIGAAFGAATIRCKFRCCSVLALD